MKFEYKIHKDRYQDAWNWWDSCNSINFGTDWSKKIESKIAKQIKGKTKKEALDFLLPYLKDKYYETEIQKGTAFIQNELKNKFAYACEKMEKVMGKPLYRPLFHFYLTTFPSIPYNKDRGFIWLHYKWKDPISTFLHELCHLQFIHYWREKSKSSVFNLASEKFEDLKEALTVIIDEDFMPSIKAPDEGYAIHHDLRQKLTAYWKKEKDFNKLVNYGIKIVNKP